MISLNRRTFLQQFTAASILSGVGGTPALAGNSSSSGQIYPAAGEITLSLLLHGMFVIMPDQSGVTLLPPHVEGETPHVYLATDMRGPDPILSAEVLKQGEIYGIEMPGAKVFPCVSASKNAVLKLDPKIQRSPRKPHCYIRVPFPHYLIPLRSVVPVSPKKTFFTDSTGLLASPTQLPLVTMLKYRLGYSGIGPDININYHLFAEPQLCPSEDHPLEAFAELKALFTGIDKLMVDPSLICDAITRITDPNGAGATIEDEHAIVELMGKDCCDSQQAPHLAIHPTACMSLIVLPQG